MLNNLKAEYVRKGLNPLKRIQEVLNCSERTARNKLNEVTKITLPEAITIRNTDFPNANIEWLFATDAA